MSLKQYRKIGMQLLGANFWLSSSIMSALVLVFPFAVLMYQFATNDLVVLMPVILFLTVVTAYYCTLPLWGAIKLAQAKKDYGEQQVNDFIAWLNNNDETTFEFSK